MCPRRQLCRLYLALFISILLSSLKITSAGATEVVAPKEINEIDFAKFCPVMGKTPSMYALMREIAFGYVKYLPGYLLDFDDNGINYDQYQRALSTDLCNEVDSATHRAKCLDDKGKPTADATNQNGVSGTMDSLLGIGGKEFDFVFKNGILHVVHQRNASIFEVRDKSRIRSPSQTPRLSEEFFARSRDFYALTCLPPKKPNRPRPPPVSPGNPEPPSAADAKISRDIFFSNVRLRGTTADLGIASDRDDFKNASPAKLTASNDTVAHKSTLDGHFALGYALPSRQMGRIGVDSIPYLKFERNYTSGSGAPKTSASVNNIGFGLQEALSFPINDVYGRLTVQPDYTYSLRNEAKVGKLQIGYQPYPQVDFIGYPAPIGESGLTGYLTARGIVNVGRVFNSGNDDTLASTNTFTQGGGQIIAALGVADPNSVFKGFSIPASYTYLYGFVGQYKAIPQFNIGISYTVTKNISITLSHLWGRNLDTFEKQNQYNFGLGVKF